MDRLVATNSVALASADTAPATGTPQYATSGNPSGGVPATVLPAYAWNMIQEELMAVLTLAGIVPDRNNWAQLRAALQALFLSLSGGTVNGEVVVRSVIEILGTPQGALNLRRGTATDTDADATYALGVDDSVSDGSGKALLRMGLNPSGPTGTGGQQAARNITGGLQIDQVGQLWQLIANVAYPVWSNENNGASLASAGYQKFASGLIVQWKYTGTINAASSSTITLPETFTTSNYGGVGIFHTGVNAGLNGGVGTTNPTLSTIDVTNNASTSSDIFIIVVGK